MVAMRFLCLTEHPQGYEWMVGLQGGKGTKRIINMGDNAVYVKGIAMLTSKSVSLLVVV